MLEGVLIDESVELGFDLAGHFGWSAATGAVQEAAGAFASKALDPFSQGGVGEVEGVRDGFDGLSGDHLADGLSPAKDAGFLRMLHKGIQGGQGTMRKMAVERAHGVLLGNHDLALIDEHVDAMLIGVIRLRLKFSHIPTNYVVERRALRDRLAIVPCYPHLGSSIAPTI